MAVNCVTAWAGYGSISRWRAHLGAERPATGQTFDQILLVDTVNEHIVFTPFTRPDRQMVFDGATDTVTMQTLDGQPVQTLSPARAGFSTPLLIIVARRDPITLTDLAPGA